MIRHIARHMMEFPPPVRDPRIIVLAFFSALGGAAVVFGGPPPNSITRVLDERLLVAWGIGYAAGGVALLLAAVWRDVITGVLIEGAACIITAIGVAVYVVGAFAVLHAQALVFPVIFNAAWGVGCLVRAWQIRKDLREANQRMQLLREAGDSA